MNLVRISTVSRAVVSCRLGDPSSRVRSPWTWPSSSYYLPQRVKSNLGNDFVQNIWSVDLVSPVCNTGFRWQPIEVPNAVRWRPDKAPRVLTDVVVAAIARGFATADEAVIVDKFQLPSVEVF